MKWWLKTIIFLMAGVILYISFAMASLDKVINDERFERLRKVPIFYINFRGEENCYKLPESGILPNNILYPIKNLRDNLWIYFSRNEIDKLRIMLLIRDKKIEEVLLLKENNINNKIIERQIEEIDNLSNKFNIILKGFNRNKPENREIQKRLDSAKEFYDFIYKKLYNNEEVKKCYE
jgi:hypothetical protein